MREGGECVVGVVTPPAQKVPEAQKGCWGSPAINGYWWFLGWRSVHTHTHTCTPWARKVVSGYQSRPLPSPCTPTTCLPEGPAVYNPQRTGRVGRWWAGG